MDLSAAVTIQRPGAAPLDINSIRDSDAVGASPLSGYMIDQIDMSSVSISAFTEDTPLVDGIDSYDPYLGARQINISLSVYGSTYADFWDKMGALTFALQAQPRAADVGTYPALEADGKRKLSFSQPYTGGTYSLYMMVRPLMLPRFVLDGGSVAGDNLRGYSQKVTIALLAEDPYKYFASTRSFTISGSGSLSVTNSGTTVAWPTVVWNLASTTTVSLALGSDLVQHTSATATVTDEFKTATSTQPSTLTSYEFFPIAPGTSTLTVVGQTGQNTVVTIREALL
jgi:hypothetical protein